MICTHIQTQHFIPNTSMICIYVGFQKKASLKALLSVYTVVNRMMQTMGKQNKKEAIEERQ